MAEADDLIGALLRRAAKKRRQPGRNARPVGEFPDRTAITLTVVAQNPEGAWTFGEEIPAAFKPVLHRFPDRDLGAFHRNEVTLSAETVRRLGRWGQPGQVLSFVMAEMPLVRGRVFTAPFQRAAMPGEAAPRPHGGDESRLLDPLGHMTSALEQGSDRSARLAAIVEAAGAEIDPFLTDSGERCAAIAADVVEASIWPPGFEHDASLSLLHETAAPKADPRCAIVLAQRGDLARIHGEIVAALGERIGAHGEIIAKETGQGDEAIGRFLRRQAECAAWQALAGSDRNRNFGSGSPVVAVAESYLDSAVIARHRAEASQMMAIAGGDDQVEDELLRLLSTIGDPVDGASQAQAIRKAIETDLVFLPRAKREALRASIQGRLNAL